MIKYKKLLLSLGILFSIIVKADKTQEIQKNIDEIKKL